MNNNKKFNSDKNRDTQRKNSGNYDRRPIVDPPTNSKGETVQSISAKKKGFYIILFIGIAAIAFYSIISALVTDNKSPNNNMPNDFSASAVSSTARPFGESVAANADTLPIDESEPIGDDTTPSPNPTATVAPQTLGQAPVSGKIIKDFSNSELMYSNTMDDWRTHAGVDIAANMDMPVSTIKDGVLKKVYEDGLYGTTVVIHHDDGTDSVYSNLKDATDEPIGTPLKMGTVIGKIGKTAVCETEDEPHLHFEIKLDTTYLDPREFVEFEEVDYVTSPTPESHDISTNATPDIIIPTDTPINYDDDAETMIID